MTNERHEKALEAAEWIEHDGKSVEFDECEVCDVRFRDGEEEFSQRAGWFQWVHLSKPDASDIVAYRIVSPSTLHQRRVTP